MFEKLFLISSPKLKQTNKNQFGFRQKTSCNRALFVLKETISKYTENKLGVKIASLDAEKAFHITSLFPINIGVKQSGIISPSLFQIFIDDLINELFNENVGAVFKNLNI